MKVLVFGGSKNIGFYSAERLLESGATVYFQLRRTSVFDDNEPMKKYITSQKAILMQGDGTSEEDVRRAWETATADGLPVDVCLFTIGGAPTFKLTKGVVLTPEDICTSCMTNVLNTMPQANENQKQPKLILISSIGLTKTSHKSLPLALKPMYAYLLHGPHEDKLGMERVVARAAGWQWKNEEPNPKILPQGWESRLKCEPGSLKHVLVVRPAMLTDGKCKAEVDGAKAYRASEEELGGYTVSRRDVAHFIVEQALKDWDKYEGKVVNVGY